MRLLLYGHFKVLTPSCPNVITCDPPADPADPPTLQGSTCSFFGELHLGPKPHAAPSAGLRHGLPRNVSLPRLRMTVKK